MGSADIARTQASYIVGIVTKSSTKLTSQPFCNLRMPNHIRAMLVAMSVGVLREASIIAKKCGEKRDPASFTNFLQTQSSKKHPGDACCDTCWNPTRGFLKCKGCDSRRERAHFTMFLKTPDAKSNLAHARCDDCFGPRAYTCKECKEVASPTVSFTEFQKTAASRKKSSESLLR